MRRPSRLTSTICGPPLSGPPLGCGARDTMPPRRTVSTSWGRKGSRTSYCRKSPVPQQATYRNRSSRLRLMSVINGGTAPNGFSAGGSRSGSAGSAGISMTFSAFQVSFSRYQVQTDEERSFSESTVLTNPNVLLGSCDGRSSSTIWYSGPKSMVCRCRRARRSHTCSACPYLPASSRSGTTPFSIIVGVPHSLVIIMSWPRCHQKSYPRYCGPRSASHAPRPVTCRVAERTDVDPIRPAVHGVRAAVPALAHQLRGLHGLHHAWLAWVGLGINHVEARRADARRDQ